MRRKQLGSDGAERLGRIDLLSDLPVGRLRELARLADEVTAEAGETLMLEGEPGFEFMMLEVGQADVSQGGERINVMDPGDSFGELAVLADGQARTASVVAVTDVRAIVLSAHFMREMAVRVPSAGARIDGLAAERRERDALREASAKED